MKVGIDLGTSYSLISTLNQNGQPVLIPDCIDHKSIHTPSSVYIGANGAFIGQLAEDLVDAQPDLRIIRLFKRSFGQTEPLYFDENGNPWYPESFAALVLKKLRIDAESFTTSKLEGAVVTVPAHFNDLQRKCVLAAADLADFEVIGLVEEPVAAAFHYGVCNPNQDQIILVYDLGGGTFDATIIHINPNGVYVLAKEGLTDLGGKEFDEKIGSIILTQFQTALGHEPRLDTRALLELKRISERIKIELCLPNVNHVRQIVVLGSDGVEVDISKEEFYHAVEKEISVTERILQQCVQEAGLRLEDVDRLLLVGGGSMLPLINVRMKRLFDDKADKVLYHEPSKAVALGAVLYCYQSTGESKKYKLPPEFKGVSGYNVGIKTVDPASDSVKIDVIIKKNLTLPIKISRTYYTYRADQDHIVLELVQFRSQDEELIDLGKLTIGPLETRGPNYPINVTVEYREDATINILATDLRTGKSVAQSFIREEDCGIARLATQRALIKSLAINHIGVKP